MGLGKEGTVSYKVYVHRFCGPQNSPVSDFSFISLFVSFTVNCTYWQKVPETKG